MAVPRLHLIVDLAVPVGVVEAAVAGGVDAVHLRDHAAPARDLLVRGRELRERLGGRAQLVVNDRLDVALALGADAVQLGGRSLPLDEARRVAPCVALGVSVHSAAEAAEAARGGASWVLLGTIYDSGSHPGQAGAGPGLIADARTVCGAPIVAIGGITAANAPACVAAGAHGVAVITAITRADDPRAAAQALRRAIG